MNEQTDDLDGSGSLDVGRRFRAVFDTDIDVDGRMLGRKFRGAARIVFGDRAGVLVWLGLALSLALVWRVGFFLTDTYTVANTLVNVADGHLAIKQVDYSLTLGTQPGLHRYEGVLYGRNYGQAFFALPFLWLLEGLAVVAEPRFVLFGAWAVGLVLFGRHLGSALEGRTEFPVDTSVVPIVASSLAIVAMLIGVSVGTPLDEGNLALVALQLSTIVAAAFAGVFAYRLLSLFEGRRVGVAAGVAVGLGTPIGFWASLPKRHVLVVALILGAIYCFARSRQTGSLRLRAGAYVFAGLVAWIHAFEGFFLVAALGSVDLATARSNGWRDLAVVALALSLALAPTLATNVAITDNPLKPPRLLPGVGVGGVELAPGGDLQATDDAGGIRTGGGGGDFLGSGDGAGAGDGGGSGGDGGTAGGESEGGPVTWLVGLLAGAVGTLVGLLPRPPDTVLVILGFVLSTVTDGLAVLSQPERLWYIFVRSGNIPGVKYAVNQYEVIELTVVESMPLLGALATLPVMAARKIRGSGRAILRRPRTLSPAHQTDLLVVAIAATFTVIYLSRLPLYSMLTVRYILPVFVLGLYGVARVPAVSAAVGNSSRTLAGAYGGTVVVGGLVVVGVLGMIDPALGEAVQFHALLNLAVATGLALVVLACTVIPDRVPSSWTAAGLGVAGGVTTLYVGLAGLAYFRYGSYALDGASVVSDFLTSLL